MKIKIGGQEYEARMTLKDWVEVSDRFFAERRKMLADDLKADGVPDDIASEKLYQYSHERRSANYLHHIVESLDGAHEVVKRSLASLNGSAPDVDAATPLELRNAAFDLIGLPKMTVAKEPDKGKATAAGADST